MSKPIWIYHGRLYHAFVFADPPTFPMTSACRYHVIVNGRRPAIGAAQCIECAVALGQDPPNPHPLQWGHNGPQKEGCRSCNQPNPEHQPVPERVGKTDSGLVAPQSAIDAMRKKAT